jgi:Uncharacterized protein conserved in bacteria (DUF2188)
MYSTRKKAIEVAREMVRRAPSGQLAIHGVDGSMRFSELHGVPPRPKSPVKSQLGRKAIEKAVAAAIIEDLLSE